MTEDVPGYRVLEQVGEGGFSVVYRAHQERLDRTVALKVLSISAVDDAAMRRFQRECKITGRLSGHPNIVTVLDTGTSRFGRPYIAMEYFERGALIDRLEREGPLPVGEALRIGVKMAGALAATHETDVLHRDVKPQNILVSKYGEPALADFGIARLTDSFDHSHTQAFTPHHAAPEVLEGRTPGVGSDIYSLGSTLYQLLAGQPAFKGPRGEGIAPLMLRIMNDPPPAFQRSDVPGQVFEVISQAMAKAPEHRFGSAVEFAQRLQQLQAELGLPITDLAHSGSGDAPVIPPQFPAHPRPPAVPEWAPTTPRSTTTPASAAPPAATPDGVTEQVSPSGPLSPWHPNAPASQSAPPTGYPTTPHPVPSAQPGLPGGPAVAATPAADQAPAPTWPPQQVQHPHASQPGSDGPRRGLIVAVSVALAGGLAVGLGALALSGGGGGPKDPATQGSSPLTPQNGGTQAPLGNAPVTGKQLAAARPYGLAAKPYGTSVSLAWRLPPVARQMPILVQQAPFGTSAVVPVSNGAVTTTISKLNPKLGYCFRVGSVPGLGADNSPKVSWSRPKCIRGARVAG
ncbi:serine/threonine-protein kinase [Actinomadura rudentiformis]|uniref:non-specific serine/threonine protein kinase n=1 Tax=Actinomadura rudentiformis TaxID=359158 RepID=A0A6H9YKQ6_9ACTN|nr:serine/threonine-protein kinase [Actinomadura rudentiformis]KAB2345125.1 protein kinase [Actinomadura rudentiformis]